MTQNIAAVMHKFLAHNWLWIFWLQWRQLPGTTKHVAYVRRGYIYEKPVLFSYIAASIKLSAGADKFKGEKLYSHRLW